MIWLPPLGTLVFGLIMGYLGQRSRMCFVGGMRDWYLVRDSYLIKGLFAFIISTFVWLAIFRPFAPSLKTFPWVANAVLVFRADWAARGISTIPSRLLPIPGDPISWSSKVYAHIFLAIAGGFGLGFFATLAGGCPFRQHIMAAEGSKSAITYLVGFIAGAILFHKFIAPLIVRIFS
jgi:uncharacterized membrane protein YedE/YeeE